MSLVQGIISDKFILVGADTRAVHPNGTISECINKVIKLNKGIIFGCTGGILDNYKLFNGFCEYSDEHGLYCCDGEIEIPYSEFVNIITTRFYKLLAEHENSLTTTRYEICSIICGYNGKEFEITTLAIGANTGIPNGIIKATKDKNFPYKGVNAGQTEHMHLLHELVGETYCKYGAVTMRQYKNILLDVFQNGAKIDTTINSNVHFESIRLKDVIGN